MTQGGVREDHRPIFQCRIWGTGKTYMEGKT